MRRITELSSCIRGQVMGGHDWGKTLTDETVQGGSGKVLPTALSVLAAAESRFMFFLVKLSGCRDHLKENDHEPQDRTTGSAGNDSGEQPL